MTMMRSLDSSSYKAVSAMGASTMAGCMATMTLASARLQGGSGGVSVHWPWKNGVWHEPVFCADPLLAPGPSRGTNVRP